MYKNYVFDLYGTLVDIRTNEYKPYLWKKMAHYYAFRDAHYKPAELRKEYERVITEEMQKLTQFDHPEIDIDYVFQLLFKNKGIVVDIEECKIISRFFRIISTEFIKLYDGVIDLLETLKKKDRKIYLLSNAQRSFTEYEIYMLGLYDYFDGIVISSDEQCKKPSLDFYNIILDRYQLNKKETIMIGNDFNADIEGSYHAGLDSLYIHTEISPEVKGELLSKYTIMDGDFKKVKSLILDS